MSSPILDASQMFPASESVRITRFDVTDRASLADVPTTNLSVGSVIDVITGEGGARAAAEVELQDGAADPTDTTQIQPSDDLSRHWQIVAGYLQ